MWQGSRCRLRGWSILRFAVFTDEAAGYRLELRRRCSSVIELTLGGREDTRMQVTITGVHILSDGRRQVEFDAAHGHGAGIWRTWRGREPQPADTYQIEFSLLDPVWLQDNAEFTTCSEFALSVTDQAVVMTVRVEQVDSDNVAFFRLGSDCLFMSDVADPEIETGRWLRVTIPVQRLELFPYDAGRMVVAELLG